MTPPGVMKWGESFEPVTPGLLLFVNYVYCLPLVYKIPFRLSARASLPRASSPTVHSAQVKLAIIKILIMGRHLCFDKKSCVMTTPHINTVLIAAVTK